MFRVVYSGFGLIAHALGALLLSHDGARDYSPRTFLHAPAGSWHVPAPPSEGATQQSKRSVFVGSDIGPVAIARPVAERVSVGVS